MSNLKESAPILIGSYREKLRGGRGTERIPDTTAWKAIRNMTKEEKRRALPL